MSRPSTRPCTAFIGRRLLISGSLADVAVVVARSAGAADAVLVFDDATGDVVDLDLRGGDAEILLRLSEPPRPLVGRYRPKADATARTGAAEDGQRTRGRPKLGVVAREVTLLPRQWEWLARQPGGASAALRRLVEDARKAVNPGQERRAAQEAAYRFMQAIAGDLPGYEEATRSLFADDLAGLDERIAHWPADIRAYAMRLASGSSTLPNQNRTTEEKRQ
ncbi:DUF2239 family protein [Rhodopseudomonas sp. BR0M22]|uniref:DUF2239 family protein n=1 Tax=Rhodopseudomonas sp. BR0M22 TaxID=2269369 RepID=UPI0013DF6B0A|nr:DUF2239 family protein [Rhodopseudomonas sp. BR0M22]MCD0421981.1 DUF2239 family protein [Rubrivivax sp. JA1024]NEW94384.1 DUF2239 family protein [Rhodopseudomonas sp. BR0M22]